MASKPWTYTSIAKCDKDELESILKNSPPPDFDQMEGYIYCGWNHEKGASLLSGEKFKKGFHKKAGKRYGFNEAVIQDFKGPLGEWETRQHDGKNVQLGFFRCSMTKDEKPTANVKRYKHTAHLNYDLKTMNTGTNVIFRPVRDYAVLPNPGDHSLVMCKAYFHLAPGVEVFYCYFFLGNREPITQFPW
jgi:hypothetical protein